MSGSEEPPDPIDLLVKAIPKHIWVTIIAVTVMLAASWLFFRPPRPAPIAGADAAAAGETLEGRAVAVLAEEIVRALAGSLGLILAVSVTSLLAGWMAERWSTEA